MVLLGSVTSVLAQSTTPPTRSVGDTWKLSDGRVITVIKVEEGWASTIGGLRDCPTCITRSKDLNFDGTVRDASGNPVDVMKMQGVFVGPDWKFYDWPLEVGKQWRFSAMGFVNQASRQYDVASVVKAVEEVKTKAGTFKAFKIQSDWSFPQSFGPPVKWINTTWYAPDAKIAVKFTTTSRFGTEWELESFTLK
jgi:hypothetical protein